MVKTIVFLPGWSFKAQIWAGQEKYFSELGFRTILCELEELDGYIKSTRLEETVFIAWSLGWFRLLDVLKSSFSLPCAIVGVSAAIKFKKSLLRLMIQEFKKDHRKALSDFDSWLFSPEEKDSSGFGILNGLIAQSRINDKERLLRDLLFLKALDLEGFLTTFRLPVFLVSGNKDIICPIDEAMHLKPVLPDSQIKVMEAGHIPFLTSSAEFNHCIGSYLLSLR
ncbi:MAG: alpha/beta hydrolase [Candidatus Omnitrophota bacterium]|nr:alpha/beta hydrolase [Candidatus Omnitrophota bacterium]